MRQSNEIVLGSEYHRVSQAGGYTYSSVGYEMDQPLFRGFVGIQNLACGIDICSSDLTSTSKSTHEGFIDRSFTIAINLDEQPIETEFGTNTNLALSAGTGAIVAAADAVRMASRVEEGVRSKSLLLRISPEHFADEDVAEEIYQIMSETSIAHMKLCKRTMFIANELANPSIGGAIGRLLNESAALEILALTLLQKSKAALVRPINASAVDFPKLSVVRDLINAEPFQKYTLTELANQAGMSLSALKAAFPQAFGKTVFQYISDTKLDRAHNILSEGDWSVSKVAYHIGYSHQSTFAAAFKRRFGISPSSLKRR